MDVVLGGELKAENITEEVFEKEGITKKSPVDTPKNIPFEENYDSIKLEVNEEIKKVKEEEDIIEPKEEEEMMMMIKETKAEADEKKQQKINKFFGEEPIVFMNKNKEKPSFLDKIKAAEKPARDEYSSESDSEDEERARREKKIEKMTHLEKEKADFMASMMNNYGKRREAE